MLADVHALFEDRVRDVDDAIDMAQRERAIAAAVARYSADRPLKLVRDITGDGGNQLTPPAEWVEDFSKLIRVEYPIGQYPIRWLPTEGYGVYRAPAGEKLAFTSAPAAGDDVRVTFTGRQILTDDEDTVAPGARAALAAYAVADALEQLAARHAADGTPTIDADAVDHNSKADRYRRLAAAQRKQYFEILGIKADRQQVASAIVDMDLSSGLNNGQLMFHGRHPRRRP